MANNYLGYSPNHFDSKNYELEDVDDDIFLNNPHANNTSYRAPSQTNHNQIPRFSSNPFEDQHQMYLDKRREIEERTLNSTQDSLRLLYQTQEVGNATALELAKQREQLERSTRRLEDITTSLRFSQRHLNSLKSVFGGLKNYLTGNREFQSPRANSSPSEGHVPEGSEYTSAPFSPNSPTQLASGATAMNTGTWRDPRYDQETINSTHTASTSRGHSNMQQQQQLPKTDPFDIQLESNLESMCDNLTRLKFLANDLNAEIESQNELLDNMNYKLEDIDLKLTKQNKDINKLMGKK